ncbi:MAG: hypothetical protein QOE45_874, partial [Frankiaceae bacterium]|nr:hypothetical protein [Frankiaceae bacterium]
MDLRRYFRGPFVWIVVVVLMVMVFFQVFN